MNYAKIQILTGLSKVLGKGYCLLKIENEIKETDRLLDKYVKRYNDDIRYEWESFKKEDKKQMEFYAEHKRFLELVKVEIEKQ